MNGNGSHVCNCRTTQTCTHRYAYTTATMGASTVNLPWYDTFYDALFRPLAPLPDTGLIKRLRAEQLEQQKRLDRKSRQRHGAGAPLQRTHRRLQTYQAAMDARFAAGSCR